MADRRILSLWFPRLAADRARRRRRDALERPLAVVGDRNGAQVLTSLDPLAEARPKELGARPGSAVTPASTLPLRSSEVEDFWLASSRSAMRTVIVSPTARARCSSKSGR